MFEESVECLAVAGRISKAKEIAEKFLKDKETPRMLFLYGSLIEDSSYYHRAWKLSNHHYYYAMNALARYHIGKKEPLKAIECFEKSLKINTFQKKSWFTLGCTYMRTTKDNAQAARCFTNVI